MAEWETLILAELSKRSYQPLKPKALARKLGVPAADYAEFRGAIKRLVREGRAEMGKNHTVRPRQPHGTVAGIFRKVGSGAGYVRPHVIEGTAPPEIFIREGHCLDAVTGDEVLVRILRQPTRPDVCPTGEIIRVLERATRQFVGTYFERDGQGFVRVDGTVFSHSIFVGDPGAKGARPDDKVVFEMLRFPTPEDRGEGVITEVLGPRGQPGVDTLSIIRAFDLPDEFPEDALEEARAAAEGFRENDVHGREDFTGETIITIDPADARDFDDAVSLVRDSRSKHWLLGVHIADVAHFAPPGSALDREARKRGNSVYLPQRVLPMFPELISNGVASLQQGRVRYVLSALMDFTAAGQRTGVRFVEGAIRVRRRFTYDEVSAIFAHYDAHGEPPPAARLEPDVLTLLLHMRELGLVLRQRRLKRGALELNMPETELEFDDQGQVCGAHFVKHDISHQIIEEFMLAANEAVAEHLAELDVPFLRRVHPAPEPNKLKAFAEFARILGYKIERETDRFCLQRILNQSADQPEAHAVHYALLRSLKQAAYSPIAEGHYALASEHYCHFTSPIRRYPDLTIHRLLKRWLRTGRARGDETELIALGEHCSKTERRADLAERELIKLKLLTFLSTRIGLELEAIVTGVADYGFFAEAEEWPVEGLVHISTLNDDYYYFDEASHSLIGRRTRRRYRLGDKVRVNVVRVDLQRRQLDFRVCDDQRRGKGRGRHS
ncbi:MAG: ribonuclease R [Gemmataceae bacterium]|nr:ribonuclease R [Gemmataceae bacterium]MDW8267478.1 ribonuclease R [Gemmataceae bacterium]